jgi:hypothetical protein
MRGVLPITQVVTTFRVNMLRWKGMNMPEIEGMNMIEEQDHLTIHQRGEEDIHMVDSHMVEGINMVVKHYHPMNRGGGYGYGGGALPPDELLIGGGWYRFFRVITVKNN